ncbi:probable protein phosphatase 2C 33 isoform X2 [Prosopis cineraria]|uniref:probable protein phosphatase 2C 33 isoform X2 n=1 Tax=Prosopis cineraria TaxID=364024 RepID=UPI00240EE9B9|nr:probable protein phosphatase 2C 33 isoform X2 [Prosopis cineraria]
MTQALNTALLLKEKEEEPVTASRLEAADSVVDVRGSDCLVGLECFLNIVRALGMGSCLSAPHPLPYSPESTSDSAKRRRRLRRSSSLDSRTELGLHKIPGRMFVNGSSEVASLFCKQGKKGINQDAMLVWEACKVMDKELKLHPGIDCFCSGTTAVTLVKQGQDLVIGNVGDSRAILGTRDHDNSLIAVQLTIDLKPNLPREAERIKRCRGRVFALRNEPEVARVWLPNADSPGLAMARAFGDFILKDFGLISVPDVSHHRLTEKDEFVVLATDGIWDVLSNQEVVDIVASVSRSSAARTLVETAVRTWRTKYPTPKVDDCAVVCLFFDSDSDSKSVYTTDKEMPEASVNLQSEGPAPENGV